MVYFVGKAVYIDLQRKHRHLEANIKASLKKAGATTEYFFFKFYFRNVNVLMFCYFEPNFTEKFLRESGFSNFGHVTFFAKSKFVFWLPF